MDRVKRKGIKLIKNLFGYILSGFIFWLPVGFLLLVGNYIFGSLENIGKGLLRHLFIPDNLVYPGFGIILWLIVFFLSGVLFKRTRAGKIFSWIPILGTFFKKDDSNTMTLEKLLHLPPCLFLLSPTCPSYGWILSEEMRIEVGLDSEEANYVQLNVYYPNVPTLVTGQIFPVRKETVIKVGNPSREIIDILLYCLKTPKSIRYLPWEDETEEEFKKRAKYFGLEISTGD